MTPLESIVARNLEQVRQRIATAASRSGRAESNVRLVGITKYVTSREISALVAAGCTELGESRPQQLWQRADECRSLGEDLRWHLVGHLQRNKVARSLSYSPLFHGVDSVRLLETLDTEANQLGVQAELLIEVNMSGEEAKHGFTPAEFEEVAPRLAAFPHLAVCGLMTMARYEATEQEASRSFAQLRELRDRWAPQLRPQVDLTELSMGMSGDFEVAIAEGATLVRVGSALWQGIV